MASEKLGRIVPLHRGEYRDDKFYELNDIVSFHGSTYWHHRHEKTRGVPPFDLDVWFVVTDFREAEKLANQTQRAAEKVKHAVVKTEGLVGQAKRIEGKIVEAAHEAKEAADSAAEYANTASQVIDSVEEVKDAANAAKASADDAEISAEIAKSALIGMTFVSFDTTEDGHLIIENGDALGTTEFKIHSIEGTDEDGHLEVTY